MVMLRSRLFAATGVAGTLVPLLAGCAQSSAQQPRMPAPADIVATVRATSITLAQVDEKALQQPTGNFGGMKLAQALFEARRISVQELIEGELLAQDAKARTLDQATVIRQEITEKVAEPTDAEAALWFEQNQSRLQGASFEQARTTVTSYLVQQRTLAVRQQYMDGLRAKIATRIMLDPPRQAIAKADRPSRGPDNAPIEMIEFSDFQCPFCRNAFSIVNQVLATYGDRIHFVYRHYPLANHPRARPAAEASQCAAEQGKFWQFYDKLFGDQSRLSDEDFKQHATQLGLETAQFNACVDSHKYGAEIDIDIQAANEAGVSGTPAFFINGRMLSGAQPFEAFKRIIDEELVATK